MNGSWDDLSIDLSFFLPKDDVESRIVCAIEADDLTSAWCINEFAELASRQSLRFIEFFLRGSHKSWAFEVGLAIGRWGCNVDRVILSVSAEVQVISCPRNEDEAKVLRKLAELVEVRVFEVHVAKASKLHFLRAVDDLWDPHVRHDSLAYAAWEFAENVEGE
jgi:hypothetical protein